MPVVTVFGNSESKPGSFEYDTAEFIGKELGKAGLDIATGAYGGVMEAVMKGAAEYGVKRIGVATDYFPEREANRYVNEHIRTDSYLNRLIKLITAGDGFIVFPGSTGTLLELSAVWALREREVLKDKPIVIIGEQWQEVIQTMGFYSEKVLDSISFIRHFDSAENAAAYLVKALKK